MLLMWYGFRRGFVEDAAVHSRDFIQQEGRILEVSPIRHLRTNFKSPEQAVNFSRIPSLRHLNRLHVSARYQDRDLLYSLLQLPHLGGL